MAYSRPLKMPTTKRQGLENFVQMIINKIEAGDVRNALLTAVDLHQDLTTKIYDDAMTDAAGAHAMAQELTAKHQAEIIIATEAGRAQGIADEKARMARFLELAQ